jgi:signal transduction histidine kinase
MAEIVASALQRLDNLIEETQAQVFAPDAWPKALGYAPWVEQVWVNYLSNAIKYGGQPPRLQLGAALDRAADHVADGQPGQVRFWVHDNGPGLTQERQAKLFTPFTRLDQIRVQGYGLGLSIVRRIIENLDGQVGVESEGLPGRGSTFTFTLPAAASTDT